ncbi:uncharacterized protein si:ch211-215k15.4 [Erpetoichthys calabaricus]|uniref:uncharacterized protein si:ch211-215k15.4 n=1 Tax=Erpetoichthys calabaricus TaxID=27687 RepID=UPI002234DAFC|nr:uncharacterized protein si:ch211-215k15.4 [Erpetoichthys calabaricus]
MALAPLILLAGLALLGHAHKDCLQAKNVALRGRATLSQLHPGVLGAMSTAVNAIDGNRDSNYHHGSCACTNVHNTPWWRVDLLANHKINMVVITNRGDCCPEQINEAEIRIGNSLENEGNNNPRCATITSIPLGVSTSYNCQGMEGRYVNVVIPGKTQHLTLCEVEVYGVPIDQQDCLQSHISSLISCPRILFAAGRTGQHYFKLPLKMALTPVLVMAGLLLLCGAEDNCPEIENVALRGKATQSQILGGQWGYLGDPGNAIDGNRNSNAYQGSCSHTESHNSPWWRVDLLEKHKVHQVVIANRGDCCPERINGAEIRIGDSLQNEGNSNPRCATITSIPAGISSSYNCNGMEGRYVNVVIPEKKEYLTLCEVEVYAVPVKNRCSSYA